MIDLGHLRLENLHDPVHSQGTFPDYATILDAVGTILERGQAAFQSKISSRLFIDGGTRDDLSELVTLETKPPETSIEAWLKTITGSSSFCLALNGLNAMSAPIDRYVRTAFNAPWNRQVGMPMGGIDTYCFLGIYPITPFGIHTDREHTFLYHLGPGRKEAWLWSPADFEQTQGMVRQQFTLDDCEDRALKVILEPGDVLYIPAGHYHVLANPEFSATLGIAPYDRSARDLLKEGFSRSLSNEDLDGIIDLDVPLLHSDPTKAALRCQHRRDSAGMLLDRAIEFVNDEARRLQSCGGMKFAPLEVATDLTAKARICLSDGDISVDHRPTSDQIVVYAGGKVFKFATRHQEPFEQLLAILERQSPIDLTDIMTGDDREDDFRLHAISVFSRHRIVEIQEPAS